MLDFLILLLSFVEMVEKLLSTLDLKVDEEEEEELK